ncbi:hypothetical protein GCM10025865_12630 [Paraoerskovia sediminicola]|uniref:Membrane protein YesL n=1 Tax=Paraoerskovia sediminicola TaxID=1138587 RepID=A0ABN6XB19_9CELL|nr:DUF624 domain-containing protein [Paraoerskovia sediminicola]BDZ41964.1 hypothetical protein GCM10025865_12630 [Paraoerskovia sediminicola]
MARRAPRARGAGRRAGGGWEAAALRALMFPTNIVLGGLVAFVVALPVVTALPATIALGRSFAAWREEGDEAVVTNLVRELRATWRRTWKAGIVLGLATLVLIADAIFLVTRLGGPQEGAAILFGAAAIPVATVVALAYVALPLAAARQPDADMRSWFQEAGRIVALAPLRSLLVLVVSGVLLATAALFPTILPFVLLSVPVYVAQATWSPAGGPGGPGGGSGGGPAGAADPGAR